MRWLLRTLVAMCTNWISFLGTIVTTISGIALLGLLLLDAVHPIDNAYAATMLFAVLPAAFVGGLLLIPLGLWWETKGNRTEISAEKTPIRHAVIQLAGHPGARRWLIIVGSATIINVLLLAVATAKVTSVMDSPAFCGTVCHKVMEPEYSSYKRSPHARVACVECHIGPGASWAVRAKIDGLRQVWGVLTGDFSRPVPSPIQHLRPARDTCEKCHWPAKFHGKRIKVVQHFADDAENSREVSAVALRIGGRDPKTGEYHGIHWHVSPDVSVQYAYLDDRRERIGDITWYVKGKKQGTYRYVPESGGKKAAAKGTRTMDCVDCHNRPTHIFDRTPADAVDRALAAGILDPRVPYIKKVATQVLGADDLDWNHLRKDLASRVKRAYADLGQEVASRIDEPRIGRIARVLERLLKDNVFPYMKVTWGTHPNHLGHPGGEEHHNGCFRCHNEEHVDDKGESLSQDCDLCHTLLHYEEAPEDLSDVVKDMISLE